MLVVGSLSFDFFISGSVIIGGWFAIIDEAVGVGFNLLGDGPIVVGRICELILSRRC